MELAFWALGKDHTDANAATEVTVARESSLLHLSLQSVTLLIQLRSFMTMCHAQLSSLWEAGGQVGVKAWLQWAIPWPVNVLALRSLGRRKCSSGLLCSVAHPPD